MIATVVLAVIIFYLTVLSISKQIKKAKSGGCSCGCSKCSSANACHGIKVKKTN